MKHASAWLTAILTATALHSSMGAEVHSALETAFAPDGKILAVTDATSPAVVLIDPANNTVLRTVKLSGAPAGLAWAPDGKHLFASETGASSIAEIDPASGAVSRRLTTGRYPRGLAVAPDGKRVASAAYFTGDVVLTDMNGAAPVAVALGVQPQPDLARQGEALFHDAGRCFQRWLSCASCHPDARADGLNWDLLNDGLGNPKNARSLVFSDRTPPLMSHGARDDLPACVRAGFVHILFTEPKNEDVQAVYSYLKGLQPVVSPYRKPDGSLTDAALRGEKLYNDPQIACAKCHPGPLLTNLQMYDVGTSRPFDQGALRFDTTSLTELWRTPPYLHDGSAVTIREVLVEQNTKDKHGVTSKLTPAQLDDLTAYLQSL